MGNADLCASAAGIYCSSAALRILTRLGCDGFMHKFCTRYLVHIIDGRVGGGTSIGRDNSIRVQCTRFFISNAFFGRGSGVA